MNDRNIQGGLDSYHQNSFDSSLMQMTCGIVQGEYRATIKIASTLLNATHLWNIQGGA